MKPRNELEQQIEAAFDFRGNVMVTLTGGTAVEGFLYNREFSHSRAPQKNFIALYLTGSGNPQTYSIDDVVSVKLSGEDHAAGKSYEEWLKHNLP